jgi:flagellar basal body-associated protein FliL
MLTHTTVHKQIEALLAQDTEDEEDDDEEPEEKSGNKVLLIVLTIVVLACIGVAVYWFVTNYLPAHQGTSALESEGTVLAQAVSDFYRTIL